MRISALALLKMAMHAKSGGNIEVMGMLQARLGLCSRGCITLSMLICMLARAVPVVITLMWQSGSCWVSHFTPQDFIWLQTRSN